MLKPDTTIYYTLEAASNVGIVVSAAVLMYAHYSPQGGKLKFYAYDVMFDGRTYKNVPEEVLKGLKNNDETNTE
jgi:hypothetical protein|tara:strand:- start:405 stop:626 length:222 start_codon:yes stop_codon:yes gene_type:complete